MMKIDRKMKGYFDYTISGLQLILPRLFGFSKPVRRIHDAVGTATAGYSLMTDYELGASRTISMKTHVTLDLVAGGVLLGTAALMRKESCAARSVMAIVGAAYVASAALAQQKTPLAERRKEPRRTPMQDYAEDRRPAAASNAGFRPMRRPLGMTV